MDQTAISRLTGMERKCLRAVIEHRSSKSVASALGISVSTVETHLKHARAKLGVSTSFQAAKLLEVGERPPNFPATQDLGIPEPVELPPPSNGTQQYEENRLKPEVREERAVFEGLDAEPQDPPAWLAHGSINTLSSRDRSLVMLGFAAVVMIALAVIPVAFDGIQTWANIFLEANTS